MAYGYDPKILKQCKNVLPWLNQTTIGNQVVYFKKNIASVYITDYVTESVPTENTVTASVITDTTVYLSVATNYPISYSNFASIKKGIRKRRKEKLK